MIEPTLITPHCTTVRDRCRSMQAVAHLLQTKLHLQQNGRPIVVYDAS